MLSLANVSNYVIIHQEVSTFFSVPQQYMSSAFVGKQCYNYETFVASLK